MPKTKTKQRGGVAVTKRGALQDAIKNNDDVRMDKIEALDDINYGNLKALKLAIEYKRPNYVKALLAQGGISLSITEKGSKTKYTVLQYALRQKATLDIIKVLVTHQHIFPLDQINVTELMGALAYGSGNASKSMPSAGEVLHVLFKEKNIKGDPKYRFYDPKNKALIEALKTNIKVAELIINYVN